MTTLHGLTPDCPPSLISLSPSLSEPPFFCYSPKHQISRYLPSNFAHTLYCYWDAFSPLSAWWIWTFLQSPPHLPSLTRISVSLNSPGSFICPFPVAYRVLVCLLFLQLLQLLCSSGKRQNPCSCLSSAIKKVNFNKVPKCRKALISLLVKCYQCPLCRAGVRIKWDYKCKVPRMVPCTKVDTFLPCLSLPPSSRFPELRKSLLFFFLAFKKWLSSTWCASDNVS